MSDQATTLRTLDQLEALAARFSSCTTTPTAVLMSLGAALFQARQAAERCDLGAAWRYIQRASEILAEEAKDNGTM